MDSKLRVREGDLDGWMDGWVYAGLFGFWPLLACSRELGFYSRELGFHGIYSFNHYHVLHMLYLVSRGSGSDLWI